MNKTEIENEVLKYFLDCLEKGLNCTIEVLFKQLENVDKKFFERTTDELVSNGLLEGLKYDSYGKITYLGIIEIEKRKLISDVRIQQNYKLRYKILEVAFNVYNSRGYGEFATYEDFNFDDDFDTTGLEINLDLLEELGFIKLDVNFVGDYSFHIEKPGMTQLQKWQKQQSLANESAGTAKPNPQSPEENPSNSELSTTMQTQIDFGKIFIGHGRSTVWKDLKDFLKDRLHLEWDEFNREPTAGIATKERLEAMLENASFAFLIMTAEDEHADQSLHARENVIHEIGLFQGKLGFRKAIILFEEGCQEFGNIVGLTQIRFPKNDIEAKFEEIRRVLEREEIMGSKTHNEEKSKLNKTKELSVKENLEKRQYKIERLKELIRQHEEFYKDGFAPLSKARMFGRSYNPRVEKFLAEYFDDSYVQRFQKEQVDALEDFLKELIGL